MRCKLVITVLACAGLVAGCSSASGGEAAPEPEAPASPASNGVTASQLAAAPSCEDAFLDTLTDRQKLAQLLTVGVTDTADAVSIVSREQIGGIFVGSWTDEAMLANREIPQVEAAAPIAPLVTIDEEGGRVSRVADLLGADPSAREAAQTMTPEQTYEMALTRGQQLRELGITVNFAPDVDVSAQPDGAVIGDRSFSDDPDVVIRYADAYARGMRDAGVLPVLKHFPGHGAASGDSHTGSVTTPPLPDLIAKDLVPYRALVDGATSEPGVASESAGVMLGHLEVPGLTAPGEPASISPAAVELLRSGAGYGGTPFDGVVFTDDLSGMKAITDRYGIADAVAIAIAAGVDQALWLTTDDVPRVLDHLEGQLASGELPVSRVDESVMRVAETKGVVRC
ncbi:glycoside hydrolase family 3 protein [Rhodococcus rhodnii]|uniref:beta-N-acetylhexosaminidase n=2 Tax=Rhodococcus rhodnii TaxID=38312 RepID=R7WN04_9NOCA|nr:glycoside hydrolase family 3 N-terminal domain-containing protein [Rhodococcus rhodnii]EOM76706.1 beta-N-acetylhexosaminidase [Rhodococcus rhodnii LMG 5362]TXG90015.1 glycoside hydrolase family 3 protein [Rhodococcus rhodnii]